ncbi:threonine ammonia-lyase [Lachnospiraceae bacterium 3-1]|nr:threonine ammonia-lyase [Lachnospiraceae bacterium 3-1]
MLTLERFEEASKIVKEVTLETKLVYSDYLSEQTGNKVYLKPENMQFTGAYKVRGAYYKISTLTEEEREKGLITASAGNHAQGVAYAAKCYGVKATIVMPTTTPLIKVNRTKGYGANVILHGDVYDESCQKAYELAEEHGYTFIHPFDDLAVATGQGTIAMEIFKELPLVEYILVPIGGGGLATGVSALAKLLNPKIKVIGVEPAGANCMQESIKAGKVTTLPGVSTIADGTAVKTPGEKIFPYIRENLDDIITVEDDELIVAFLDMVENHKMVVENSGLLTVAALRHLNVENKRVVSILSGGNMDVITMSSVVQQGLIFRDRIFTVSVLLPDKPGELCKVADTIAKQQGNVIKLEHNQFVSTNRNAAVELRITMEAFGTEHKEQIMRALEQGGYQPKSVRTNL